MLKNLINLDVKKILRSRTIWFNFLTLVAGIALALADYISLGGAISGVAILNIILRIVTKTALQKTLQ